MAHRMGKTPTMPSIRKDFDNVAHSMKDKRILIQIGLLCAMLIAGSATEAQPVITLQPTNQSVAVGSSTTFSVSVSGTGPFTYQWQFNGTNTPNSIITTVAGNGSSSFSGDGGPATNAALNTPTGVAADFRGNLYITDYGNNRIRKVDTNGVIMTVVGNGTRGFSGDGGAATNATIAVYLPNGLALDANGNLFIADENNQRIRIVNTNGIITTVAGNGSTSYSGDGGLATSASLNYPLGVAVDAVGNLFIVDELNQRIRKVNTNGIITTIAGNGSSSFSGDGGSATNAALSDPTSVALDSTGNLFIAVELNQRIRKINSSGIITTVAGNGTSSFSGDGGNATNAALNYPFGVAVDAIGNFFIADISNQRVRMVTTNGIISTAAGNGSNIFSGDGGVAFNAGISARGVAVDAVGNLFIVDTLNNRIRKVTIPSNPPNLPTLTIYQVSTNNSGNYSVIITSSSGSVTSSVANLTVGPAVITQQPQNQFAVLGGTTAFSVVITGMAPLTYQWYFSNSVTQATAGAVAQLAFGFIYGSIVTNGGLGYTTLPQVQFIGGGGSGAGGTATVNNGIVTAITMTNAGSGYTSPPIVLIDSPNLLTGQTNATLNLNSIATNNVGNYFVIITNIYGSITSSVATLTIASAPTISQQPVSQIAALGSNANFNVIAASTAPLNYQWWMTGSQQSNATAVPVVINGFVLAANMTSSGAGYLTVPTIQFVGGSGSGATGTVVVSNRMVTTINMSSAGSGYTTPPTIQIAAPTAISLAGQTNNVFALLAVANTNAGNYYVVVTNNLGSVTSSVASLVVAPVGYNLISGRILIGGKMSLSFVGIAGGNYALDRSFNLLPANWIPQVTNPADVNGILIFTNTPDPTTNNFWRIRSVP